VADFALGDQVFNFGSFKEEHIWLAAKARRLTSGVPWQAAVCLDPADFALGAVRDGNVRIGDAVAVFGLGAIGLIALQFAKLAGAYPVIAVDPIALRRDVALEVGADLVLDPSQVDAGLEIKLATDRRGADVVIEYSGHYLALQAALRGVAYGGTVVAGAFPGAFPAGLDFGAEAHMNRPKIIFSRACSEPNPDYPNWNEGRLFAVAWRLLASGAIQCEPLVQPVVPFADLLTEYPKIATHPQENIKLGVRY
jgi:threonine dehydrogenase-like Zn-dependent dehydrogenase